MSLEKRLNKYISETGYCSRREADTLISTGRVRVNGGAPQMGDKVSDKDTILIDGKPLKAKPSRVYIAYNKPVGVTCTTERKIKSNIVSAINYPERIFPIGRLDRPSEGLIFLTNEGDIVNKILRSGNNHEKEYEVQVDKPLNQRFVERMANGIPILDTITKKCKVEQVAKDRFRIILTQGLNRQIRRMCEYLGYEVIKLKRTRIMNVTLEGLKPGQWRHLSGTEMATINDLIADSGKTQEHSEDRNKVKQPKSANPKGERMPWSQEKHDEDTKPGRRQHRRTRSDTGKGHTSAKDSSRAGNRSKSKPFSKKSPQPAAKKQQSSPSPSAQKKRVGGTLRLKK